MRNGYVRHLSQAGHGPYKINRSSAGLRAPSTKAMQVRPQRVGDEHLLPDTRRELVHQRRRVLADALQQIDEVVLRVDVMQPPGGYLRWPALLASVTHSMR